MVKMSKIKTSQQVRGNWGPHALSETVSVDIHTSKIEVAATAD